MKNKIPSEIKVRIVYYPKSKNISISAGTEWGLTISLRDFIQSFSFLLSTKFSFGQRKPVMENYLLGAEFLNELKGGA